MIEILANFNMWYMIEAQTDIHEIKNNQRVLNEFIRFIVCFDKLMIEVCSCDICNLCFKFELI